MKTYPIIIEKGERNFSSFCPDIPGCVTTGRTLEETRINMQEALEFHLKGLRKDNDPIAEPGAVDFGELLDDTMTVAYVELNEGQEVGKEVA